MALKVDQLIAEIKRIIASEPRWIDQVSSQELKGKLETEKNIKCSIATLNRAMLSITSETEDGYDTGEYYLVMGEDYPNKGKSTGLKKYYWFVT